MRISMRFPTCVFLLCLIFAGSVSAGYTLNASSGTTDPTPVAWTGSVSLVDGATFGIHPVNDPNTTLTVNRTSALGALDAAATAGTFTYTVKSSEWGPFIDSIGGVAYNATSWDSWLYQVNGVTADVGAADYTLSDGDVVTYWYGAWGSTPEAARDLVTITATVTAPPTPTATPTVTVTTTPDTNGPFGGTHVPSTRIEAEYFDTGGEGVAYHDLEPQNLGGNTMRAGEGVDIETEAGVTDVGYIRAGEYLKYSIDSTIAGNFTLTLRAANPDTTSKAVTVYVDGVPAGQVSIGGTGGWTAYRDFASATPLSIPAGRHVVTLAFEGVTRLNLDWLGLSAGTAPTTTTPTPTPPFQTVPYGSGNTIPGRVQAENFDRSGTAAAYSDTTVANEGGAYRTSEPVDIETVNGITDVGWIRTGEWLVYTLNIADDGTYTASFNAANPDAASKPVDVYVDGAEVGTAQIGGTGSFGTFRTFACTIALTAGTHQLKLVFPSTRLNLDYIEFAQGTATQPTVTTTPTVSPSGAASFTAAPLSASKGTAVKFRLAPAAGKAIRSAWWSFDKVGHLNTWNSRDTNPTFFYPAAGAYTPLVKITYTDGTIETVERVDYVRAT